MTDNPLSEDIEDLIDELPHAQIDDDVSFSDVHFLNVGQQATEGDQPRPAIDAEADKLRKYYTRNFPQVVGQMVASGLVDTRRAAAIIQAATPAAKGAARREYAPGSKATTALPAWKSDSRQFNYEDLYATLGFVPLPRDIALELYERELFEENHISGACIDRTATAAIKRGIKITRFEEEAAKIEALQSTDEDAQEQQDGSANDAETLADHAEQLAMRQWLDRINPHVDFRHIIKHTSAAYTCTGNGYVEVIREVPGDAASKPARLATMISSTMRVLKGHRGFVQWVAGRFVWFNNYTPEEADRAAGVALWRQYWIDRAIDPDGDAFLSSPFKFQLSANMPDGVFNPWLTEVKHFKSVHLSSVYYGFPRDYRLGRLHALLKWSIDFNISLQRNNQIPPFALIFHGTLTEQRREDLQNYLQSLKGAQNYGRIPILEAAASRTQPAAGTSGSPAPRAGLEIVPFSQARTDGIFLDLWARVIKDFAMHYGMPLDLLTTENSNRSTIEIAEQLFNDFVVNEHHEMYEPFLKQLTYYDIGWMRRRVEFEKLDTDDQLQQAQIASLYRTSGVLSANEIRADNLGKPARPGGDQYIEPAHATIDDEPSEELMTRLAAKIMSGDMTPEEAHAYLDSVLATTPPGAPGAAPARAPNIAPAPQQGVQPGQTGQPPVQQAAYQTPTPGEAYRRARRLRATVSLAPGAREALRSLDHTFDDLFAEAG